MRPRRRKANRFSHACTRDPDKTWARALRDPGRRRDVSVAPARHISKKAPLSYTLLCVPLNFGPSHDLTEEFGAAIA
jgi:hypothetical protein